MRLPQILAMAVLALASLPVMAQDGPIVVRNPSKLISASGRGEVRIKPDVVSMTVGVQERGADVAGPRERAAKKVKAILAALKSAGVKESEAQTAQFSISRVWEPLNAKGHPVEDSGPGNKGHFVFQVTNSVSVRTGLLNKAGEMLDAVVTAGGNSIGGPTFGLKDGAPQVKEALALAVKDASAKAEAMADAAGVRIASVERISEQGTEIPSTDAEMEGQMKMLPQLSLWRGNSTPISIGEVVVSASVTVEFRFQ